ncbi:MAG: hypothetical protein FJW14_13865 [Acidimicrobiia bacterium]|nr:hypothetical protein [Acidimicrobiia bacterium]
MRRVVFLVIALAALVAATAAYAHHSYAATYNVAEQITLEGKLVQFVYRNPHSFVHVQAPDQSGAMQRWAVEWGGTAQLANDGVNRDTLKVGDEVVILGRPSRVTGEYRALMVRLTRPSDGFTWGGRGQVVD